MFVSSSMSKTDYPITILPPPSPLSRTRTVPSVGSYPSRTMTRPPFPSTAAAFSRGWRSALRIWNGSNQTGGVPSFPSNSHAIPGWAVRNVSTTGVSSSARFPSWNAGTGMRANRVNSSTRALSEPTSERIVWVHSEKAGSSPSDGANFFCSRSVESWIGVRGFRRPWGTRGAPSRHGMQRGARGLVVLLPDAFLVRPPEHLVRLDREQPLRHLVDHRDAPRPVDDDDSRGDVRADRLDEPAPSPHT